MEFTGKLKKLLLLLIIPITFSACSISQNYQASTSSSKQFTDTEQLAVNIKKDIKQSSAYQNQKYLYQAKIYKKYIDELIEQVKEEKISEKDARNLLIKSYRQFKTGKYNSQEELMNEAPIPVDASVPHYIPPKPGAL